MAPARGLGMFSCMNATSSNSRPGTWPLIHVDTEALANRIADAVNTLGTGTAYVNHPNSRRIYRVHLKGVLTQAEVTVAQEMAARIYNRSTR